MTTLQDHLDDLDPAAPVRQFATGLAWKTAIEAHRAHDYVSLSPSWRAVLPSTYTSVGCPSPLDPERAAEALSRVPGRNGGEEGRNDIPAAPRRTVGAAGRGRLDPAVGAVGWRAAGPTSTLGGHAENSQKVPQMCPTHFYELSPSGPRPTCGCTWASRSST
jgi:hypothetical protein